MGWNWPFPEKANTFILDTYPDQIVVANWGTAARRVVRLGEEHYGGLATSATEGQTGATTQPTPISLCCHSYPPFQRRRS